MSAVVAFKLEDAAVREAAAPAPEPKPAAKPAPAKQAAPRKERPAAPVEVLDWVKPVPRAHAAGGNGEWKEF